MPCPGRADRDIQTFFFGQIPSMTSTIGLRQMLAEQIMSTFIRNSLESSAFCRLRILPKRPEMIPKSQAVVNIEIQARSVPHVKSERAGGFFDVNSTPILGSLIQRKKTSCLINPLFLSARRNSVKIATSNHKYGRI